ncbi:monovalent cation/H(+) antiporter subunit G [Thiorhodococcus minor]|uniref:Monovalent cation/H(+) antiporter subunit G n=1 Tax=Thiorhodococcus minor TaxID=57489 RepID=A0A6M0JYP4_9GAMM|nr:monovalent cation/H(+) antiporter subunit G [Thiorhodococcus minor]NEV62638.1 monovalent cation/H(+) antiporter subunit G [Thiorhodococcus minor]
MTEALLEPALDLASLLLLSGGVFLGITGAVGVLRFPDFFTRLHAAGVTDTLSAGMILAALMLQAGLSLISVKLAFILLFLLYTSPVASHALARAAVHAGVKPVDAKPGESSSPS